MTVTADDYEVVAIPQDTLPDMPADDVPAAHDYEYACTVCGTEIFYGGRGPKPKYCVQHKKGGASKTSTPRANAGKWQQPLMEALNNQFIMIGMVAYPFNQYDGSVIINGAPGLSQSLIGVAEQNPSVRDALQKFVTAGAWSQVAAAVAQIAIPIAMNHGWLPPMKSVDFLMKNAPATA